ncbi:MAG: hypothetical protein K8F91_26800, partial [Candidatus Obscuribacterales bacterium]|nr:hypothetical protein [Candidatus Obscuribacterales bacterium]
MAFTPSDAAPQSGRDLQSFQPDSGISPFDKLDRPDASLRPGTSSQSSDLGGPPVFARVDDNRLSFSLPPLSFSGDNTREIDQAGPPPSIESSLRQDASALPSIDKSFESLLPARPHSQSFGANGEVPEVNLANAIKAVSQGNCTMAAELTRVEPSGNPMDQIDRNRSPIASLLGNLRSGGSEERNFDSWESYLNLRNDLDALTSDSGNDLTKKAIGLVYAEGDPTYNSAEVAR